MLWNYQFPLGALIHFHQHIHFDLFVTTGVILILMVFSRVTRVVLAKVTGLSNTTHCRWYMYSGRVPCFAIVVSWYTVGCLTAAPQEEAQPRRRAQLACDFSTTGEGSMMGIFENEIVSSGLGHHDFLIGY